MPELADFQAAFAASLTGDAPMDAPPGLAVHRNTVAKGLSDVLAAGYPTVERLLGPGRFGQAALAFARAHPPASPVLADYGEGFAGFLDVEAGVAGWIAQVARIDRAWTEAHNAPDAAIPTEPKFDALVLLHPAARLLTFELPAVTIWTLNRPPAPVLERPVTPDWRAEACLVGRPGDTVIVTPLDADALAFLRACQQGATLGEAAVALLEARPEVDLVRLFAGLLAAGAFAEPLP